MKVHVVELSGSRRPFTVELTTSPSVKWESAVLVLVQRQTNPLDLENHIKAHLASPEFASADAVFLRLHWRDFEAFTDSPQALAKVASKLSHIQASALSYGEGRIHWKRIAGEQVPSEVEAELWRTLRAADIKALFDKEGVILPTNDSFVYEGPNGGLYSQFVRVGTALNDISGLDSICFWLAPLTESQPFLLLDSGTLAALGLHIDRYRKDCLGEDERLTGVDWLASYDEDPIALRDRLTSSAPSTDRANTPVLVVCSVTSSGRLLERVSTIAREAGFSSVDALALIADDGTPDHEVFCFWPGLKIDGGQPLPRSLRVPISAQNYFPELTVPPELCAITRRGASAAYTFFDRYRSVDCIAVHRSEAGNQRHHMIYVDIATLCGEPAFRERVNERLSEIQDVGTVDLILSPEHAGARQLAGLVARELEVPAIACDPEQLPRGRTQDQDQLRRASRILLVDDALITGNRLKNFRHFLRACDFHTDESPIDIEFFVGLSRPQDNGVLRYVADTVHGAHHFHAVEHLTLPNWGEDECPWCWELRQMERFADQVLSGGSPARFQARFETLSDVTHGLRSEIFLPWSSTDERLPHTSFELGPQSVFHTSLEAELFAAVASSVQDLRKINRLTERQALPVGKMLDPRFWLAGRYYDSVLTASLLRCTRRHDVRNAHYGLELTSYVGSYLQEPYATGVRGEILLACARRQLPVEQQAAMAALADKTADPGVANWLTLLLQ